VRPRARRTGLRYGIEGEVLLARAGSFEPLWHESLRFHALNALLEAIPTDDVSRAGLRRERPHPGVLPYVVEGYDVPAPHDPGLAIDRLPKGLEIRTPICGSLAEALELYAELFGRLHRALAERGLAPVHVSHHPRARGFVGPRNSRREDWWRWQMQAMTTYGPDLNIGLDPGSFWRLDLDELERRFDFYAPAMVAFTLDAPLYAGELWRVEASGAHPAAAASGAGAAARAGIGRSVRTYRRSPGAPALLVLPDEEGRLEFKAFDTTASLADLENDMLLFATVLLDRELGGRASPAERVQALREVAVLGWDAPGIHERAEEVLAAAARSLPEHGLDPAPLARFRRRLELGWVPADATVERFRAAGSVEGLLRTCTELVAEDPLERALRDCGAGLSPGRSRESAATVGEDLARGGDQTRALAAPALAGATE
jgi:hypothetical protein